MRMMSLIVLSLACSGCNGALQPTGVIAERTTAWRRVADEDDRERLRDWRATFVKAIEAARREGHGAEIDREGALLNPDGALAGSPIPNGLYQCRVIKLGAKGEGNLAYVSYPGFACRVAADQQLQRLTKLSGSQRYVGVIFPHDGMRSVFLGTLALGDERRALQYGQDPTRNVAGYVERIGAGRWRLLMPRPHFESQFDVMELVARP
jgi:hypothetical protein